jgi:hypothetical protein
MDCSSLLILGPPATVGGAAIVLLGVLKQIRSSEKRADIAARQALRDREFTRVHEVAVQVMAGVLAVQRERPRADGGAAVAAVEALIEEVIPRLQLEQGSEAVIASIWELRTATLDHKVSLHTQPKPIEQQALHQIVGGDRLDRKIEALAGALEVVSTECKAFLGRYGGLVVDQA